MSSIPFPSEGGILFTLLGLRYINSVCLLGGVRRENGWLLRQCHPLNLSVFNPACIMYVRHVGDVAVLRDDLYYCNPGKWELHD